VGVTVLLELAYAAAYRIYTTPVLQSVAICCSVFLCVHRSHGTASTRVRGVIQNINALYSKVLQFVLLQCVHRSPRSPRSTRTRTHGVIMNMNQYCVAESCTVLRYVAVCAYESWDYVWLRCVGSIKFMSLLQNIVSFIGLCCKRNL